MQVLAAAALALAGVWLAGCKTTVYKPGDRAADTAQAAAIAIQTEGQSLTGTTSTLNDLVDNPSADLKPQFRNFNAALDSLVAARKRGEAARDHLARSSAAFFADWDKQLTTMTNIDVRTRSEARKADVSRQLDAANNRCIQAQESLRSSVGYLQDIRRALSTDLTRNGVEAVKSLVRNANTTVSTVQADLTQASTELKALSAQMSSRRTPITQ